jgi:hypothetical protein
VNEAKTHPEVVKSLPKKNATTKKAAWQDRLTSGLGRVRAALSQLRNAAANEELLVQLLPPVVHVAFSETTSARILALPSMNEAENEARGPGVISSWRALWNSCL